MSDMVTGPKAALREALVRWVARYKADMVGSFSSPPTWWDRRTDEDRASWEPGVAEEADELMAIVEMYLTPPGDGMSDTPRTPAGRELMDAFVNRVEEAMEEPHSVLRALSDLAIIGLVEHIEDLHRQIGDLDRDECPFVRQIRRLREATPRRDVFAEDWNAPAMDAYDGLGTGLAPPPVTHGTQHHPGDTT